MPFVPFVWIDKVRILQNFVLNGQTQRRIDSIFSAVIVSTDSTRDSILSDITEHKLFPPAEITRDSISSDNTEHAVFPPVQQVTTSDELTLPSNKTNPCKETLSGTEATLAD